MYNVLNIKYFNSILEAEIVAGLSVFSYLYTIPERMFVFIYRKPVLSGFYYK
jgi:hypothetical protein